MNALKRRGAKTDTRSDEQLREDIAGIRSKQRELRRERGAGRYRDQRLRQIDQDQAEATKAADEQMRTLAMHGTGRALGAVGSAISPAYYEAHSQRAAARDAGFWDELREIVKTSDDFCDLTAAEMANLLEPLEVKARAIADELGRRHDERRELRDRLRQLETTEV